MNPHTYKAIVIGATGAVGHSVVDALLASPRCQLVTALVRRNLQTEHDKLQQHVVDFDNLKLSSHDSLVGHQVAFCCLGVGAPSKVPKEELWRVDVSYVEAFSEMCKANGVQHISLLGSAGADAHSLFYVLRVKAAAEAALTKQGFDRVSLFRPGMLLTPKSRFGMLESFLQVWMPRVSNYLPGKVRPIRVEDLGKAMVINAELHGAGVEVLHYPEMQHLLTARSGFRKAQNMESVGMNRLGNDKKAKVAQSASNSASTAVGDAASQAALAHPEARKT